MKSPCTLAFTPVAVNPSIDSPVGSKTVASFAYSSAIDGAANANPSMTMITNRSSSIATIDGHLSGPLFCDAHFLKDFKEYFEGGDAPSWSLSCDASPSSGASSRSSAPSCSTSIESLGSSVDSDGSARKSGDDALPLMFVYQRE